MLSFNRISAFFFFFKQKTAYEMRISDWSSDVCSSDLHGDSLSPLDAVGRLGRRRSAVARDVPAPSVATPCGGNATMAGVRGPTARPVDRKSVVSGKSVSVRVDLGGRRIIKNKKNITRQILSKK